MLHQIQLLCALDWVPVLHFIVCWATFCEIDGVPYWNVVSSSIKTSMPAIVMQHDVNFSLLAHSYVIIMSSWWVIMRFSCSPAIETLLFIFVDTTCVILKLLDNSFIPFALWVMKRSKHGSHKRQALHVCRSHNIHRACELLRLYFKNISSSCQPGRNKVKLSLAASLQLNTFRSQWLSHLDLKIQAVHTSFT